MGYPKQLFSWELIIKVDRDSDMHGAEWLMNSLCLHEWVEDVKRGQSSLACLV